MQGPMRVTGAGPEIKRILENLAVNLGPYTSSTNEFI